MVLGGRAGDFASADHSTDSQYEAWHSGANRSSLLDHRHSYHVGSDTSLGRQKRHHKRRHKLHHRHPAIRYPRKSHTPDLRSIKANHSSYSTNLHHSEERLLPYIELHWKAPPPTTVPHLQFSTENSVWAGLRHELSFFLLASMLLAIVASLWLFSRKISKQKQPPTSGGQCRTRGRRPVWNEDKPPLPFREGVRSWRPTEMALHHAQHADYQVNSLLCPSSTCSGSCHDHSEI